MESKCELHKNARMYTHTLMQTLMHMHVWPMSVHMRVPACMRECAHVSVYMQALLDASA